MVWVCQDLSANSLLLCLNCLKRSASGISSCDRDNGSLCVVCLARQPGKNLRSYDEEVRFPTGRRVSWAGRSNVLPPWEQNNLQRISTPMSTDSTATKCCFVLCLCLTQTLPYGCPPVRELYREKSKFEPRRHETFERRGTQSLRRSACEPSVSKTRGLAAGGSLLAAKQLLPDYK